METIQKTKANNIVNVLHPYRSKQGIWAFDDEDLGIVGEVFVGDINKMIDMFADEKKQITAYISSKPIANGTLILNRKDDMEYEGMYQLEGTEIVGWLCPCLLNYFPEYVEHIYVKIKD